MGNITDSGANDDDLSTYLPPELRFSHVGEQPPVAFVITLVQKGVCDCVGRKTLFFQTTNNSNGSRRSHGSGVLVPGLG
jgi:hypothetical protein